MEKEQTTILETVKIVGVCFGISLILPAVVILFGYLLTGSITFVVR